MKKLILFLSTMLIFSILLLHPVTTEAKMCTCRNRYCAYASKNEIEAREKVIKYINQHFRRGKQGKYKNFKVKFIKYKDLTYNKLTKRRLTKIIYVSIDDGFVMNKNFDGLTTDGFYISYRRIDDTLRKGNHIRTYCVYNPRTAYFDDICFRTDRVINRNKNKTEVKQAKKIFYKKHKTSYYNSLH